MNLESFREWLPPIALRTMQHFVSDLRFRRYDRNDVLQTNLELKGKGGGRRAFLIATGPSLNQEDLTLLCGEDCFTLSNFFLHEDLEIIRPKYHFFVPYHEPLVLENYIEWLREADRKLPAETAIVLGHSGLPLVEKYQLFPARKIHYLYLADVVNTKKVDLTRPVLSPQTGTIMILPVLLYMGYSEIYLLGCDHTVMRDYGGTIHNFYQEGQELRANATTEKSWDGIVNSHVYSMNVFLQYGIYRDLLARQKVVVKNLSKDSWLDCFPSGVLDEVCC